MKFLKLGTNREIMSCFDTDLSAVTPEPNLVEVSDSVYAEAAAFQMNCVSAFLSENCLSVSPAGINTLDALREVRNRALVATDWWALPDNNMTSEQAAYRQALRDLTKHYSSLDDVVWPTKPSR
jgi:hypothetical protein